MIWKISPDEADTRIKTYAETNDWTITKGIKQKEYKTKDGKTHTALKSRENYIV